MSIIDIVLTSITVVVIIADSFMRFLLWDKLKGRLKGKVIFSSRRVIKEVGRLNKKIRSSDFRPDVIIGIGGGRYVGGGIVGNFLASSKFLDFPALHLELPRDAEGNPQWNLCDALISARLTDGNACRNNFLVVDDRMKTGCTIKGVVERLDRILRAKGKENPYIWAAVIVLNPNSRQEIGDELWERTFYSIKSDKAVDFPWFI